MTYIHQQAEITYNKIVRIEMQYLYKNKLRFLKVM